MSKLRPPVKKKGMWVMTTAQWEDLMDYEEAFAALNGCYPDIELGFPGCFVVTNPNTGQEVYMGVSEVVLWTKGLHAAVQSTTLEALLRRFALVSMREVFAYEFSSSK